MAIFDDTRSDWNARPPLRENTVVAWTNRKGFSWHWAGYPTRLFGKPHSSCLAMVREWQRQHQDPKGRLKAKDIGYNGLICVHARAIEGRGIHFSGSHSPGVNYAHEGFQFMVGEGEQVTAAMFARAVRLRADVHALAPNANRDWSHKDDPEAHTECAGAQITKWVHTGGPTKTTSGSGGGSTSPIPTPTPTPEEDDMPSAQEIADAVWAKQLAKPGNAATESAGSQLAKANVFSYRALKSGDVAAIAAAVAKALPADAAVNVNDLAKAIVVELGKDT